MWILLLSLLGSCVARSVYHEDNYEGVLRNASYQTTTSPEQSLYDWLWNESQDIVGKVLQTDFLKEMNNNTLQAERYIQMTMQDIYYVAAVVDVLVYAAANSEVSPDIKHFLVGMAKSYDDFAKYLLTTNSIHDSENILPNTAVKVYVESYKQISEMSSDKLYLVVGLLPCSRLWPHIAAWLNTTEDSPYYSFKKSNMKDNSRKKFEALLESYRHEFDESEALLLFRGQLSNELMFFSQL
ncbi:uncharacterized protein LOC114661545 [Erpetoichthys calabaricus]|uniref:Uncharacterized LOC114661545 n=1 Tax=Erpetoichthys calabaricus TaxID=27687 RepID=A0A8C4SLE0_ERPCA|nr:uncharacterized protein LOC114661545 [Erpetoichthys calabaricus]